MKLKYLIVITHLMLYVLSYFGIVVYNKYFVVGDLFNAPDAMVDAFIKIVIILITLTILPIAGTIIGVAKKAEEIKIGFFIATINAIVICICFFYWWWTG